MIYLKKEPIPRDTIISKRVNDLQIGVFYKCPNNQSNCQIEKKDVNAYDILVLYYHGFDFNPQNITPITPVKKKNMNYEVFYFHPEIKIMERFRWIITRFEDEKGLLKIFDFY